MYTYLYINLFSTLKIQPIVRFIGYTSSLSGYSIYILERGVYCVYVLFFHKSHMRPRNVSRSAPSFTHICLGDNRNSHHARWKFVPCSSLARACINTRKARRSIADRGKRRRVVVLEESISVFSKRGYVAHLKMEITQDAEPDFSNARTLHFHELIERKDEDVRSIRDDIFDTVYRVTTVKG